MATPHLCLLDTLVSIACTTHAVARRMLHTCRCVGDMLLDIAAGFGAQVVVAGHNQHSIQMAAAAMQRLGLPPQQPGIHFAQLMGMCDCATFTLANSGFRVMRLSHIMLLTVNTQPRQDVGHCAQ